MSEPKWTRAESCGCRYAEGYSSLCHRHWNEIGIRAEIDEAVLWAKHGPLNPGEWSDRRVLRFFDQLAYWAAKGVGEAGSVGDIYSASSRERER